MGNSSGGFASAEAAESKSGSSASTSTPTSGFRMIEPPHGSLLLAFNSRLECDACSGDPACFALPPLDGNPTFATLFSGYQQIEVLSQAAQKALAGLPSHLELGTESGIWNLSVMPRLPAGAVSPDGVLLSISRAPVPAGDVGSPPYLDHLYRQAAEDARVGVWEWFPATGELNLDPILLGMLGFPEDHRFTLEEACQSLLTTEDSEYLKNSLATFLEGGRDSLNVTLHVRTRTGDLLMLRIKGEVRRKDGQCPEVVDGIALDITPQRDLETRLKKAEGRLRDLFENATDMMYSTDIEGNFRTVNKAFQSVTGYTREELLTMNLRDLVFPEQRETIERILVSRLGGDNRSIDEITIRHRDGRRIYLETSNRLAFEDGRPSTIQGIGRNVTERKQLEAQLRQAQKMEAVGTLAGGIAHEFNNQLTGILGFADLLKLRPHDPEKTVEAAEIIQKAAERATSLTSQLIGFARQGKTQNAPVHVAELISELTAFLRHTLPRTIRIEHDAVDKSVSVQGDHNQLHQALLNLALNARDAMPSGGQLQFQTQRVHRSFIEGVDTLVSPGEHWVRISVRDSGEGIPQEHLSRIFEPFFTTKPVGKGSGMGLAMVYRIVRNHGGVVHAESKLGEGTTFHILLPLMTTEQQSPPSTETGRVHRGNGLILIVDDEPVVLAVAEVMLKQLGYQVISATSGSRAIEIYRSMHKDIALVFLDVMMPDLDGRECAHRLRNEFPDVRILMTSGYQPELSEEAQAQTDGLPLLPKPYQLPELSQAIERVLAEKPAAD